MTWLAKRLIAIGIYLYIRALNKKLSGGLIMKQVATFGGIKMSVGLVPKLAEEVGFSTATFEMGEMKTDLDISKEENEQVMKAQMEIIKGIPSAIKAMGETVRGEIETWKTWADRISDEKEPASATETE